MAQRLFCVERHSSVHGWERLSGFLKTLKEARDASKIFTETTGRITRTHRASKRQSQNQQPMDIQSWLLEHGIQQY